MHELRSAILSGAPERRLDPNAPKKKALKGSSLTGIPVRRTESRVTNQRRGDRLAGVIEVVSLTFRRRRYEAQVVNLSSGGVMISCDIEPRIGETVSLALEQGKSAKCYVRWIRGSRIGLEFDGFTLLLGRSDAGEFVFRRAERECRKPQPRDERQSLVWLAHLVAGGDTYQVKLRNVSPGGALLECAEPLAVDLPVLLDLSGAGMITGTVRWSEDRQIGIRFDRQVDLQAFSNVSQHSNGGDKIDWLKPNYLNDELSPESPWAARWEKLKIEDLA